MRDLVAGNFAKIRGDFDPNMMAKLSEGELKSGWARIAGQFGAFASQDTPVVVPSGGVQVVNVAVMMQKGPAQVRVSYDKDGKIAGLYLLRPGV